MRRKHTTIKNAISSVLLQIVTIISGFIVPRLIISTFGSEVNGLVSSLNQFLNYVTLLEGGLSAVIMSTLYKPLIEGDENRISSIVKTTKSFYAKIAYGFIAYSIILGCIYPFIVHTKFSFEYIFSLTLILAVQIFNKYNYSISWRLLLNADKQVYYVSFVQILIITVNTIVFVLLIRIFPNIHILKLVTAIIYLLQPVMYSYRARKRYKIVSDAAVDTSILNDRWAGFGINMASFVHYNTDVTVLTVFTSLTTVSIYSVYTLVTQSLRKLITAVSSGIIPTLGQAYASGNSKELNKVFDRYEIMIFLITFVLFTTGALLITPFVSLYTSKVADANYYQPVFGYIFIIAEAVFCLKEPYVNLSYAAGKFKDVTPHAVIEAVINIVVSVLLVRRFGLIGVAIGTLIANTYRTIYQILYLQNHILMRPFRSFLKKLLLFVLGTCVVMAIAKWVVPISAESVTVLIWIKYGFIYFAITCIIYGSIFLFLTQKQSNVNNN